MNEGCFPSDNLLYGCPCVFGYLLHVYETASHHANENIDRVWPLFTLGLITNFRPFMRYFAPAIEDSLTTFSHWTFVEVTVTIEDVHWQNKSV